MKKGNKKIMILYILAILKNATSKDQPTTQSYMLKTLELLGFECNRKTLASYIDALIDFGYDIVKLRGGGLYLRNGNDEV